jgi:hypothetical protein
MLSKFFKSCCLKENVQKYGTSKEATDEKVRRQVRLHAAWGHIHNISIIFIDFSTANMISETPKFYVIRTLPVLISICKYPMIFTTTTTTTTDLPQLGFHPVAVVLQ